MDQAEEIRDPPEEADRKKLRPAKSRR